MEAAAWLTGCLTLTVTAGVIPFVLTRLPYVPSSHFARSLLREAISKYGIEKKMFVDLGAGNGVVVQEAAQLGFQTCIGVERNPWLALAASIRCASISKVNVVQGDIFRFALGKADVVYIYGSLNMMELLSEKLIQEMKPGSILISNTFALPNRITQGQGAFVLLEKMKLLRIYRRESP